MRKIKNKLVKAWDYSKIGLLSILVLAPSVLAIISLLGQGFYFTLTGTWYIPAEQLFIGFVTSLAYSLGGYKLYVYLKLLENVK